MKCTTLFLFLAAGLGAGCHHDDTYRRSDADRGDMRDMRDDRGMVEQRRNYPADSRADMSRPQNETMVRGGDQQFVNEAGIANMAEVEMGRMGVQKGTSDRVKSFGQRMIDDHTKAGEELKTLARSKNMPVPMELPAEKKAMGKQMQGMSGMEFDRHFIDHMVEGHEKAVALFEKESNSGQDAALKAFAARTLPTLRSHLQLAKDIQASMGGAPGAVSAREGADTDKTAVPQDDPLRPKNPTDPASPTNPDYPSNPGTQPTNPNFPPR